RIVLSIKTVSRDGVTASTAPFSAAAPAGVHGYCTGSRLVLNGSVPPGTKTKITIIPIAEAVAVIVQDSCQVPADSAIADRLIGAKKIDKLYIWVMSPMTAAGEPPGGTISTARRVTVVGTKAPVKENTAAANNAHTTLPGTTDQSGPNTITDVTAMVISPVSIKRRGGWPRCNNIPVTTFATPLSPPTTAVAIPTSMATSRADSI